MKHIGLFEGIGGFSLAARWAGWETTAWCEINPFGQRVLRHHFPKAAGHEDITKTDFTIYNGRCDILTGGFPCQGFSLAGKRMGTADARYLWPAMLRCIDETQPTWVVGENVTGLLSMEDRTGARRDVFAKVVNRKITRYCEVDHYEAVYTRQAKMLISSICEDLEERGYEVQPIVIPAAGVGAPHKRERVWIVAHASSKHCPVSVQQRGQNKTQNAYAYRQGENGTASNTNHTRAKQPMRVNQNGQAQGGEGKQRKPQPEPWEKGCNGVAANAPQADSERTGNTWSGGSGLTGVGGNAANADSQRHASQKHRKARSRQYTKANPGQRWQDFPTQPPVCSRNDGFSGRLADITFPKWRNESIKALGNAIVPQVAYQIFQAINETEQH